MPSNRWLASVALSEKRVPGFAGPAGHVAGAKIGGVDLGAADLGKTLDPLLARCPARPATPDRRSAAIRRRRKRPAPALDTA